MSTRYPTVEKALPCPNAECQEPVTFRVGYSYDPGCWMTPNGDGWPASLEVWVAEGPPDHCPTCGQELATMDAEAEKLAEELSLSDLRGDPEDYAPDPDEGDWWEA